MAHESTVKVHVFNRVGQLVGPRELPKIVKSDADMGCATDAGAISGRARARGPSALSADAAGQ